MSDKKEKFQPPVPVKKNIFGSPVPIFDTEDIGQTTPLTASFSDVAGTTRLGAILTFNSAVSFPSFKNSDIEILDSSGTIRPEWDVTVSSRSSGTRGGSPDYRISSGPPITESVNGNYRIRIKANSVQSLDNRMGPNTAVTSPAVLVTHTARATPSFSNIRLDGSKIKVDLTFDTDITHLDISGFEVFKIGAPSGILNGWVFDSIPVTSATITAGTVTTISVTPPANTNEVAYIHASDSFIGRSGGSPTPNISASILTNGIYVNNTTTPAIYLIWNNDSYSNHKFQSELSVYGANLTGIETGDFAISGDDANFRSEVPNFSIDPVPSSISDGSSAIISSSLLYTDINQNDFRLILRGSSVRFSGKTFDSPNTFLRTNRVVFNFTDFRFSGTSYNSTTNKLSSTLQFNNLIEFAYPRYADFSTSNFEVLDSNGITQTGWVFDTPPSFPATRASSGTISVTPPANVNGNFRIKLKESSVFRNTPGEEFGPERDIISRSASVDTRSAITVSSFTAPTRT